MKTKANHKAIHTKRLIIYGFPDQSLSALPFILILRISMYHCIMTKEHSLSHEISDFKCFVLICSNLNLEKTCKEWRANKTYSVQKLLRFTLQRSVNSMIAQVKLHPEARFSCPNKSLILLVLFCIGRPHPKPPSVYQK